MNTASAALTSMLLSTDCVFVSTGELRATCECEFVASYLLYRGASFSSALQLSELALLLLLLPSLVAV